MKLTVLTWIRDASISFIGRVVEFIFRVILLFLPLGFYLLLIQNRQKASTISNISVFTNDDSRWQHIFPGFILIAIDHKGLKKGIDRIKTNVQFWVQSNKYMLGLLFMILLLLIMIVSEVLK